MTGYRLPDEQAAARTLRVVFRNSPDALLRIVGVLNRSGIALVNMELQPAAEPGVFKLEMGVKLSARDCRLLRERLRKLISVLGAEEGDAGEPEGGAPGDGVGLSERSGSRSGSDTGCG